MRKSKIPSIGPAIGRPTDFHDSSFLHFEYHPIEDWAEIVVSTRSKSHKQKKWRILMSGVLEMHLESLGNGTRLRVKSPVEIYDIYDDVRSAIYARWRSRLQLLGLNKPTLHHLVFASSFLRGWGQNEDLEGIHVVCRKFEIKSMRGKMLREKIA
jgi:hypothetical protein